MLLVNFSQVSKDFSGNPVFDEIDLEILEGERIGLVGENGTGKSTLLELVAGLDTPTEGNITRRRNLTIGYLLQQPDPAQSSKSIYEAVAEVSSEVAVVSSRLRELESRMSDPDVASDADEMEKVLEAYGKTQERFEALGGYTQEHKVEEVLGGLGFRPEQYEQKVGTLSGGEKSWSAWLAYSSKRNWVKPNPCFSSTSRTTTSTWRRRHGWSDSYEIIRARC